MPLMDWTACLAADLQATEALMRRLPAGTTLTVDELRDRLIITGPDGRTVAVIETELPWNLLEQWTIRLRWDVNIDGTVTVP